MSEGLNGFVEIENNFRPPGFFDIDGLIDLPIYKHRYGQPMEANPTKLYWTEYQPYTEGDGTISFARKLYLEYPDVALYVAGYLERLFGFKFDYKRVNLLKTRGSIRSHIDESNRACCINIGLRNSSAAITRSSNTKDFTAYEQIAEDHVCQDNHVYLLDTSSVHEVKSLRDEDRFLFTYGLGRSFDDVYQLYKRGK